MTGLASCMGGLFRFFICPFPTYLIPSHSPAIQSYQNGLLQQAQMITRIKWFSKIMGGGGSVVLVHAVVLVSSYCNEDLHCLK